MHFHNLSAVFFPKFCLLYTAISHRPWVYHALLKIDLEITHFKLWILPLTRNYPHHWCKKKCKFQWSMEFFPWKFFAEYFRVFLTGKNSNTWITMSLWTYFLPFYFFTHEYNCYLKLNITFLVLRKCVQNMFAVIVFEFGLANKKPYTSYMFTYICIYIYTYIVN